MKKSILFLITLFSVAFLYAQNIDNNKNISLHNENLFQQAELIFEGRIIKDVATYYAKDNENENWDVVYVVAAYKVQRVYKGDTSLVGKNNHRSWRGC